MLLSENEIYHLHFGDCITHMAEMDESSMDMSVFSPPFPQMYSYTSLMEDVGNSENLSGDGKLHLSFFYNQLLRVMKPGRVVVVHITQLPIRKSEDENMGMFDFRGLNIRIAKRAGFIYDYDWLVTKNPQAQAIRTHRKGLLFATLGRDGTSSHGAIGDYLIKFRKPGENKVPVISSREITNEDWIKWAECAWTDIRETHTLNVRAGRGKDDVKHICPLQLDVIERLVKLFTNRDEIVFSPFAGIGSEGYQAILLGRRFYGCEIKQEYYDAAIDNLERAVKIRNAERLF